MTQLLDRISAMANYPPTEQIDESFDLPPFMVAAKVKAVGNGVPLAMGRAVAAAVSRAMRDLPLLQAAE